MRLLLRLALLAYPQPLRERYAEELAEFPITPLSLIDIFFAGLRERLDNLIRDVRHASRALLRTPGVTSVAVLALALGVGANVAVYSVVRPVLLDPLPFPEADRLYTLRAMVPAAPGLSAKLNTIAYDYHYLNWRDEATRFDAIEAWLGRTQTMLFEDRAELASVQRVSPGFFRLLGQEPRLGRGFGLADYAFDAPNVALVSERFWRARFGGEPDVLGKTLTLNEELFEIVGVAPAELDRFSDADVWQPLRQDEAKIRGAGPNYALGVLARLAPRTNLEDAREELDAILKKHDDDPYQRLKGGAWATVERLDYNLVGDVRLTLRVLWGAVALVLLIACSNVAGVLLVRALARHGETGVRLALGAGKGTLFRQALTESALLALFGGAAGVLLAYGGVRVLMAFLPERFPRAEAIAVDANVLLFAAAVATLCGFALGLAPAWAAFRQAPAEVIRQRAAASTMGGGLSRLQGGLVAMQVALAAVLLAGAGLFLHSLVRLGRVDIGVNSPETASLWVTLPRSYPEASQRAYFRELLERARALPGVESAALSNTVPLSGFVYGMAFQLPDDIELAKGSDELRERNAARRTMVNTVSEDYFRTVGARLLQGRPLERGDDVARNALINRRLADTAFPADEALGKTLALGSLGSFTVVGVTGDYRQLTPRWPIEAEIFLHWRTEGVNPASAISVRPKGSGASVLPALRDAAIGLHGAALVFNEITQADLLASKSADDRFRTGLIALFAIIALALAGSGIFATVSFTVSRRTREFAIRRALGATPAAVCAGALRGALLACASGAAVGLTAAYWLRSLTDGMLFEVDPVDPATYAAAALVLLLLAIAASLGPASRAARLDPARNLRAD